MRIAYFITAFGLGGAEMQVYLIAREMQRRGADVIVVRLKDAPSGLLHKLSESNIPTISLHFNHPLQMLIALNRARRLLRQWRPNVVHSHMVHANIFTRLLRLIFPVPRLICTAHSSNEGGRMRMWAYRITEHLADLTTNVSPEGVEALVAKGAATTPHIIYIPQLIDTERFKPDKRERAHMRRQLGVVDRFVFLAVGRLAPEKDYRTLITAFREIIDVRREAVLLVVGDGPERSRIERLIETLDLRGTTTLLGAREDIPALLNVADCVVISSLLEGGPMILLEAMCAGKPVVTTRVGIAASIMDDYITVVPIQSPSSLADGMLRAISRPIHSRPLPSPIMKQFSPEEVACIWKRVYESDLSAVQRRHPPP